MPETKITLAHSGKQHSYHVAKSLLLNQILDVFYTSSYVANKRFQEYFLSSGNTFFTRRFVPGLSGNFVKSDWNYELKEFILRKIEGKSPRVQNAVYERDVKFDLNIANALRGRKSNIYWGFQGSSHQSIQSAKALGKFSITELATAHVTESKRILGEEKKLHPEWADSLDNLVFPVEYERRLVEEPHLADVALAASSFTKQTLLADGISESKIRVLPLGIDINYVPYQEKRVESFKNRPLKLLYAGTLTQRKGLKYLLEAMRQFDKSEVQLTCIGGIQGSGKGLEQYKSLYEYRPAVSQLEMFALYQEYDALILPSVFEGFGLVIVEAMAAGLPVIATPHTMGPEIINEGHNGYIVPIRDIKAISESIIKLRSNWPESIHRMSINARESVLRYTWEAYRQRQLNLITELNSTYRL